MNEIKIGLIGCGKQAQKHVSGLKRLPGVRVVLADIDAEQARRLAEKEQCEYLPRPQDIFNHPDVAAIDVCTPTGSHYDLLKQALEAGKHFLCEKPLTDNLGQARELTRLAEEKKLFGMVGFIYRFAPVFEKAREILGGAQDPNMSPALGRIVSACFRLGGRGSHQVWKHRRATNGGAVNEMLVHMLDLALWYFGPPRSLEVLACDLLRPTRSIMGREVDADAEDYVLVRMQTGRGVDVVCQADLITPAFTQYIEVQGERGTFFGSIQADLPSFVFVESEGGGFPQGRTALDNAPRNLYEAQMSEFVTAVRGPDRKTRCSLEDSVTLLETLELIKQKVNR
ncbi:MAG: Gfo/Idh/MocA family oxidoreductase [Pseudomonadota bacterium]